MKATIILLTVFFVTITLIPKIESGEEMKNQLKNKLAVLWTSGDPEVAHKVCFMYTYNAKKQGWFDEVVLIVWGPSAKLLAEDDSLKTKIRAMKKDGVILEACKACADMYEVSGDLEKLGIDVKYMGVPLSDMLKQDWKVLTF